MARSPLLSRGASTLTRAAGALLILLPFVPRTTVYGPVPGGSLLVPPGDWALGIAIFGSIGVAIYRGLLGPVLPAGLPVDVSQAAMATLGGAVVAAQQLPGEVGAALVGGAREAFLRGLVLSEVISGVGALALALFAWVTFRRVGVSAQ